jgi:hypothetical protein
MTPITRGTIVRLRWDNIDMNTVGLVCEEQKQFKWIKKGNVTLNWEGIVYLC